MIRLQLGVEIVEIGPGPRYMLKRGPRRRSRSADRLFLAGLHVFIGQQDFALGLDASIISRDSILPLVTTSIRLVPTCLGSGAQHP